MFLAVAETIIGSLMFGGVGIVKCLFNLLYYVIWFLTPRNYPKGVNHSVDFEGRCKFTLDYHVKLHVVKH